MQYNAFKNLRVFRGVQAKASREHKDGLQKLDITNLYENEFNDAKSKNSNLPANLRITVKGKIKDVRIW